MNNQSTNISASSASAPASIKLTERQLRTLHAMHKRERDNYQRCANNYQRALTLFAKAKRINETTCNDASAALIKRAIYLRDATYEALQTSIVNWTSVHNMVAQTSIIPGLLIRQGA